MHSKAELSNRFPHMGILDAVKRTYRKLWPIGGDCRRESKESVLLVSTDDDDDFFNPISHKIRREFFPAVTMLILLYACTSWTLTKYQEKRLDRNYTRILHVILNGSRKQHPTKQQLHGHLPPIAQTFQARRARHAGYS